MTNSTNPPSLPLQLSPGELETLSANEVAQRLVLFWVLPHNARATLVFGGWLSKAEVARATYEELLQTKDMSKAMLSTIRRHIRA